MHVRSIIEAERMHISTNNIILGVISQGFAIASHVMVSSGYGFGAFLAFCGWMPSQQELSLGSREIYSTKLGIPSSDERSSAVETTPITLMHC